MVPGDCSEAQNYCLASVCKQILLCIHYISSNSGTTNLNQSEHLGLISSGILLSAFLLAARARHFCSLPGVLWKTMKGQVRRNIQCEDRHRKNSDTQNRQKRDYWKRTKTWTDGNADELGALSMTCVTSVLLLFTNKIIIITIIKMVIMMITSSTIHADSQYIRLPFLVSSTRRNHC